MRMTNRPERRARKTRATRASLSDAAFRLFARDGYDQVTVEAIAEAADVSPMTFYRHFPTKASVVVSVALTDALADLVRACLDQITDDAVRDALERFWADSERWAPDLKRRLALITANEDLRDRLWLKTRLWATHLLDERGQAGSFAARAYVVSVLAVVVEAALTWAEEDRAFDLASLRRRLIPSLVALAQAFQPLIQVPSSD